MKILRTVLTAYFVCRVIAPLDPFQADALQRQYKATTGKDLIKVIEKEVSVAAAKFASLCSHHRHALMFLDLRLV